MISVNLCNFLVVMSDRKMLKFPHCEWYTISLEPDAAIHRIVVKIHFELEIHSMEIS